jgi:hypothetical protein
MIIKNVCRDITNTMNNNTFFIKFTELLSVFHVEVEVVHLEDSARNKICLANSDVHPKSNFN